MYNKQSLFLQQSYIDTWDDYQQTLHSSAFNFWHDVILTASNPEQAQFYRQQLEMRIQNNLLPFKTHYLVIEDMTGKRIGSGGATLNVLKNIREQNITQDCFKGRKILLIHSGGDSKRIPQYSACGKLFSPVPRILPDGRKSTLFDEFMIQMSGIAKRLTEGMLVLSGDVLLLFNPLQFDISKESVTAISIKEDVIVGQKHGVYLADESGSVKKFFHKRTSEELHTFNAVNPHNKIDIDTGVVLFSPTVLNDLISLLCTNGKIDDFKCECFMNEKIQLNLYGDFLYPMAIDSTKEEYLKEDFDGFDHALICKCREIIWERLRKHRIHLNRLSPAKFLHFGTSQELLNLLIYKVDDYRSLSWSNIVLCNQISKKFAANNTYIGSQVMIHQGSYLESCYLDGTTIVGNGCILSHVYLHDTSIPDGIVLHGLKLKNGKYVVRIYGTKDNPKKRGVYAEWFGKPLQMILSDHKIQEKEIWDTDEKSLWSAKLFPSCETLEQAVQEALYLYNMANGRIDSTDFLLKDRYSLKDSFAQADMSFIINWEKYLEEYVQIYNFVNAIQKRVHLKEAKKELHTSPITQRQQEWLLQTTHSADFMKKCRIYYAMSNLFPNQQEFYKKLAFDAIRESMIDNYDPIDKLDECVIKKDFVQISLPLRVNWGGGWSDTPPYCMENGGTVLNAAIKIDGNYPVLIQVKRIVDKTIILESTDTSVYQEITDIREIQNCNNPFDTFALHKAALISVGLIPLKSIKELDKILESIGGGIYLSTQVIGVPKGSGLGTSSILSAGCIKGLYSLFGKKITPSELYKRVLYMEQLMSTGGGWQDQVGGVIKGIKLISSRKGIQQELSVQQVKLSPEILDEFEKRFILIYTGQRRLARNLLREVVGKYIASDPVVVSALNDIQRIAVLMRFELERGNLDAFADLFNIQWELSKKIDHGCTNTCIEEIFEVIDEFISGKMICGAGGGGFLQVILKKDVPISIVKQRLYEVFQDSGVEVYPCTLDLIESPF